ncbi:MAG: permease prefix domain 1-containing protein [Patescibacteria group bacterium]|jgi:hypothetical protein
MTQSNDSLEQRIGEWKSYLRRHQTVSAADADELEDHLRSQTETLTQAGLSPDEAFLVAVKRMGELDAISREFAHEYSERLWKQLVVAPSKSDPAVKRETMVAVILAVAAALTLKLPELFGQKLDGSSSEMMFYARNVSLFILPWLVGFFAYKRRVLAAYWPWLAFPFVVAALLINFQPFVANGHTEVLAIIHLPIALWLVVGIAYLGHRWREAQQRINFVRFSGEWFIYYTLMALGGGILTGLTVFIFEAIGANVETAVAQWLIPCGAAGAVIIGAWLVEAKQSVIENMAPVLTMIFTPLFTLLLIVFMITMLWTGSTISVEREVLIGFNLLLVLVMCLVLYALSARDLHAGPGRFDTMRLILIISALIVDVIALVAMVSRIWEFGFSPNKTVALGLNILLLINLTGSAWLYGRFLAGRTPIERLLRWQTSYLPIFAAWALIVVALIPLIFRFK